MNTALIVVDMQKDFCEKGALAVPGAEDIIPTVNKYVKLFYGHALIIFSRDWHHKQTAHFDRWPEHCVQDTFGAEFHEALLVPANAVIISKGMGDGDTGYSAFEGYRDAGQTVDFNLSWILAHEHRIKNIYVCGLATDYCVRATVLDALRRGYETYLLHDAIKAVNKNPEDGSKAIELMEEQGAKLMDFATLKAAEGMVNGK